MERYITNRFGKLRQQLFMIAVILTVSTVAPAKPPEWFNKVTRLQLLSSTRSDVEITFENLEIISTSDLEKAGGWGVEIEYRTSDGLLEVEYASGKCSGRQSAYDVPEGVVVELRFYPSRETPVRDFELRLSEFSTERVDDVVDTFVLRNRSRGIEIVVSSDRVSSVELYPSKSLDRRRCKSNGKV